MFFGFTSNFQQLTIQIPETAKTIIIRLDLMPYIDQSGIYAMEDILLDLRKKQVKVLFVGLSEQPRFMIKRIDIIPDLIPKEHIFDTFSTCLNWVKQHVKDKI